MTNHAIPQASRGLVCPGCGHNRLRVAYTRQRAGTVVRVRRCGHCHRRIVTHERIAGSR
jgi:transcriptional regulator NrdR family protein